MTEKEMRQPVVSWLGTLRCKCAHECLVYGGYCDVIGFRFAKQTTRRIPPLEFVIAVELKVKDIAGVIRQAVDNKMYANYSYCAMPSNLVRYMRASSFRKFKDAGVGLLSVYPPNNSVLVPISAQYNNVDIDKHKQKWWNWQKNKLGVR